MRRKGRVDANQGQIVEALRAAGYSVAITSSLGNGFPDLVVGGFGRNFILECKDGNKPPSAQKLTRDEAIWHENWRGDTMIVNSPADALAQIGRKHE